MSQCYTQMLTGVLLLAMPGSFAAGQSSSLYPTDQKNDAVFVDTTSTGDLAPAIAAASFVAVNPPDRQIYVVNDLIEIIIRESTSAKIDASLETGKDVELSGEISEFPNLNLRDLLEFQLYPNSISNPLKLDVEYKNDFGGEGTLDRRETITGRIAARVVDIKPNGTLVLEARKHTRIDQESMTMILTGTCRADDVTISNTILSSQLYDLHLDKQHTGELRKATKKGVLTRVIEFLFNF